MKGIWMVGLAAIADVAIVATAAAPSPARGAAKASPKWTCSGAQKTIFNNGNGDVVANGGTPPTFATNGKPYCLVYLETYHWNDKHGAPPGTIALQRVGGEAPGLPGKLGPYAATGTPGQDNVPNANWDVFLNASPTQVLDGSYRCIDSDPATWSSNQASGGQGFCRVDAIPAHPVGKCSIAPSGNPGPRPCADLDVKLVTLRAGFWGSTSIPTASGAADSKPPKKRRIAFMVDDWLAFWYSVGNGGDDDGTCRAKITPPGGYNNCGAPIPPGGFIGWRWWFHAPHAGVYSYEAYVLGTGPDDPDLSNNEATDEVTVLGVVYPTATVASSSRVHGAMGSTPHASAKPSGSAVPGGTPTGLPLGWKYKGLPDSSLEDVAKVEVAVIRKVDGLTTGATGIEASECDWLSPSGSFSHATPSHGRCLDPTWLTASGTKSWSYSFAKQLPAGDYIVLVRSVDKGGAASASFTTAHHTLVELHVG